MVLLQIPDEIVERLNEMALKKGVTFEEILYASLDKGINYLEKVGNIRRIGRLKNNPRKQSAEDYIRKHYSTKTDKEMAESLGYHFNHVKKLRTKLGLAKSRGRSGVVKNFEDLHALIRSNFEDKSDADIGTMVDPPVSGPYIRYHRLKLGLRSRPVKKDNPKKPTEQTRAIRPVSILRSIVDPEEFDRMVTRGGYNAAEYFKFKKLQCSRQRYYQILKVMGLKFSPKDRSAEWRQARKLL